MAPFRIVVKLTYHSLEVALEETVAECYHEKSSESDPLSGYKRGDGEKGVA